jgi:RNA polymerase sigma-70 factor (ECF subfamily)
MGMEREELERRFAELRPSLERYAARLAGESVKEDLVQETFARALSGIGGFREEASLAKWLYRIVGNLAADEFRRRKKEGMDLEGDAFPADCEDLDESRAFEDLIDDRPWSRTDEVAARREMGDCIAEFVRALQPSFKAVILLREFEHRSYEEIAEVTGTTAENVRVRVHRARAVLGQSLEKDCHVWRARHGGIECMPKSRNKNHASASIRHGQPKQGT